MAYLNTASALHSIQAEGDEGLGVDILQKALEAPTRQIAENAGFSGSVAVETIRRFQKEQDNRSLGFDILEERYCDMFDQGIVDPTEVVVASLLGAASCAGTILTTEALVADVRGDGQP